MVEPHNPFRALYPGADTMIGDPTSAGRWTPSPAGLPPAPVWSKAVHVPSEVAIRATSGLVPAFRTAARNG
ncbi:hypothetical protein [Actinokineospora iranica]|uniref:Uncharacterized protein n=1 Tax=Actinokineospora iranica TaxID=1271860 RepID=A0A1G6XZH7_9PSEU|nr:hypothetical protein [Actinokineospora iranica]SDD83559.1 hypothetical protein SAMN05216174_11984 [Actinokineospora iranica]